ncbi:hypothetical protein DL767_003457 [Monosporascus sp. MG133]|nr:hypothetical protein DL767_003457 [Monosporascus sp. MG133]
MRVMSGPHLALAVSRAGGLGFIGPGAKPEDTDTDLATARELLGQTSVNNAVISHSFDGTLPIGVGFQLWNGDIEVAVRAVGQHRPCAAWLFAPSKGQPELDEWTTRLHQASPGIQIWVQIGTVAEAVECVQSSARPEVLVVQGAEAGGHGRKDGLGIMSLFPEVQDAVRESGMPLVAAGGIADGRGVAAASALGASGVAMGTRFLASTEARIKKGYQDEVVRARDGAHCTTRTMLYNQLRGTTGWPEQYSPRGIINRSWHDYQAGMEFDELKRLHDEAERSGDKGWGPEGRLATYAGAAVGLVHSVKDAGVLVEEIRTEARDILRGLGDMYSHGKW